MVKQIQNYVKNIRIKQLETLQKIGHIINVSNVIIGKGVKIYHQKE
jgi:hypothetical protein